MPSILLPVALATAGAAALINFWLALRIGQIRRREGIAVGDGGNEQLCARMRAQSNFTEYTPIILVLIALIELGKGTTLGLWAVAALYMFGRVLHALGMDGWMIGRRIGIAITMLTMIGLGAYAVALALIAGSALR